MRATLILSAAAAALLSAPAWGQGSFTIEPRGRILIDVASISENLAGLDASYSGNELRAARIGVQGAFGEKWRYVAEGDFGGDTFAFKDVALTWRGEAVTIQAGHLKTPNGIEHLTSGRFISLMERGSPTEAFRTGRRLGVIVTGSSGAAYWQAGAFGGTLGAHAADFHISDGSALAGRFVYTAGEGDAVVHFGVHARALNEGGDGAETIRVRARPGVHLADRYVDARPAANTSTLLGAEAAWIRGRFHGLAEIAREDSDEGGSFDAASLTVGWFLTADSRVYRASSRTFDRTRPSGSHGAWEIVGRVDVLDAGAAGRQTVWTGGVNWYATEHARISLNAIHADIDGSGARFGSGDVRAVQMRLQYDW